MAEANFRHGDPVEIGEPPIIVGEDDRRLTDREMEHAVALLDAYKRCKAKGPGYAAEAAALRAALDPIAIVNTVVRLQTIAADGPYDTGEAWPNDDRDAWMLEEKLAGKTHGQIISLLNREHPEWEQIESEQGVGQAIKRFCVRYGRICPSRKRE